MMERGRGFANRSGALNQDCADGLKFALNQGVEKSVLIRFHARERNTIVSDFARFPFPILQVFHFRVCSPFFPTTAKPKSAAKLSAYYACGLDAIIEANPEQRHAADTLANWPADTLRIP